MGSSVESLEGGRVLRPSRSNLIRLSAGETPERERFAQDVHRGLASSPKSLPSLYFYDARGSELFRQIMSLPEYYLTRAEGEIFERHGESIARLLSGFEYDVVDLGAGDGTKTLSLLEHLSRADVGVRYRPVDVSEAALEGVLDACTRDLPGLDAMGIVAEYGAGVRWLADHDATRRRLVLWLGSNVGNLDDAAAGQFFHSLREALREGDHVLVGFDLVKDVEQVRRAYDDARGVTAEFNLNLLRRINRELDATFDVKAFKHYATYAPALRRMESYLLSRRSQIVTVQGRSYSFDAWEPLHTEISRKYRTADISRFAKSAGFTEVRTFFDEEWLFADALFRVDTGGYAT